MDDMQLTCSVCQQPFAFTASEQAFYQERGFQVPKRCKDCRQARRSGRQRRPPQRPSVDTTPRTLYPVPCADCDLEVQLAFPPRDDVTARCAECFARSA